MELPPFAITHFAADIRKQKTKLVEHLVVLCPATGRMFSLHG